jgi:hypothetical protein
MVAQGCKLLLLFTIMSSVTMKVSAVETYTKKKVLLEVAWQIKKSASESFNSFKINNTKLATYNRFLLKKKFL